jgi:hypothetical protein
MIQFYNSGYITFRKRKIGIVWSGQTAEHVMANYTQTPLTHPLKHIRIQQLAKNVKQWKKEGNKRYTGVVEDHVSKTRFSPPLVFSPTDLI